MTHIDERNEAAAIYQSAGYSLVELMVVVAIIALIGAISIPMYKGYVSTSQGAATRQNAEPLHLALEDYFLDNSTYAEGDWIPDGAQTLESGALGWHPDGDQSGYNYSVVAGPTGTIASSYVLTVTNRSNTSIVTTCTRNQTTGTFNCVTTK